MAVAQMSTQFASWWMPRPKREPKRLLFILWVDGEHGLRTERYDGTDVLKTTTSGAASTTAFACWCDLITSPLIDSTWSPTQRPACPATEFSMSAEQMT